MVLPCLISHGYQYLIHFPRSDSRPVAAGREWLKQAVAAMVPQSRHLETGKQPKVCLRQLLLDPALSCCVFCLNTKNVLVRVVLMLKAEITTFNNFLCKAFNNSINIPIFYVLPWHHSMIRWVAVVELW